jgi:tagaturonate reductase
MEFAAAVKDRFRNPYIKHRLLDISLNSCSKWCARVMPSLLGYVAEKGQLPTILTFSLAAFIKFYQGKMIDGVYTGTRTDGTNYPIKDDAEVLSFFCDLWDKGNPEEIATAVLSNTAFWDGHDLSQVPGLTDAVSGYLVEMDQRPVRDVVASLL